MMLIFLRIFGISLYLEAIRLSIADHNKIRLGHFRAMLRNTIIPAVFDRKNIGLSTSCYVCNEQKESPHSLLNHTMHCRNEQILVLNLIHIVHSNDGNVGNDLYMQYMLGWFEMLQYKIVAVILGDTSSLGVNSKLINVPHV